MRPPALPSPGDNLMNTSLLAAQFIILFAFFFRSFSGFGGALLSIPLLVLFFPLKFIVPVESVLEVALSLMLVPGSIRKVDRANLLRLLAGAVPGSLLGVYFLDTLGDRKLEMILGLVIVGVALSLLRKSPSSASLSNRWGLPAGIAGGIVGGLFGTSGPAYVAYLSSQSLEKEVFRATLILLFAVEYTWRLGWYVYQGLLDYQGLQVALMLLPALIAATVLGHFSHLRIGEAAFRRGVTLLLLASGILCFF